MTTINGKIPLYDLTALSVGGYLKANAAYWFEQWRIAARKAGYDLTITSAADAFRTYAIQERIFRERYRTLPIYYAVGKRDRRLWNGIYWYRKPGFAAAAVPGTSNHGEGTAVDLKGVGSFTSKFFKWLSETGPSYGFTNTEGRGVDEYWHWVHNGKAIPSAPKPTPPTQALPTPVIPNLPEVEENMLFRIRVASGPAGSTEIGKIFLAQFGPAGHCLFQHISPEEDGVHNLIGTPTYEVSHGQKDLIRLHIIKREAEWRVV